MLSIIDSNIYVPETIVTNDFYEKKFNLEKNWISKRTGIQSRHLAKDNEATSDLAVKAIEPMLKRNNEPIQFLICATSTPDSLLPSTANRICKKLNLNQSVFCFDIMAACSGFLYALSIANAFILSGMYSSGIVVGAEKMSTIINSNDPYTSPLFGDGAGAFLVKNTSNYQHRGIISTFLESDSAGIDKLFIRSGGSEHPITIDDIKNNHQYVTMDGKDVFINAIMQMVNSIEQVILKSKLQNGEVDFIIPHQANQRISDAVFDKMSHLKKATMCSIIEKFGNIATASIPVTYHLYQDQFTDNKNIIMVSFGAGFNFGAIHIHT